MSEGISPTSSRIMNAQIAQTLQVSMLKKTMDIEKTNAGQLIDQLADVIVSPKSGVGSKLDISI